MNKLFFALICSGLMFAAIMTVRAQEENTDGQSVLKEIALNNKEDAEIRKLALARITDLNE